MNKKNIILLIIAGIFFIVALIFFVMNFNFSKNDSENIIETEQISKTKDIEGIQYSDGILYKADGSEIKISEYKDKPIVLFFFNKQNEDSMKDLQELEKMYKSYEEKIKFFVINTAKEADQDLQSNYSLEICYDFYEEISRKYNISEVPSFIYINKENEVFNAKSGFTTTDALEANLDILSENY